MCINPETLELFAEERTSGVSASINSHTRGELRMGTFEGITEPVTKEQRDVEERFIYGIRFFTTPGYDESEVPKSELAFMDEVREKTREFFKAR